MGPNKALSRDEIIKLGRAAMARNEEGRGDGILRLSNKRKEIRIRVLPPIEGKTASWFHEVGLHYLGERSKAWCPQATANLPCPICTFVQELRNSKSEADQKKAGDWKVKRRQLMWVVDRGDREPSAQLFEAPSDIFNTIMSNYMDPEFSDITDIASGRDYLVKREGAGGKFDTTYKAEVRPNVCALSNDEHMVLKLFSQVKPYAEMVKLKSEEELIALLSPGVNPEDAVPDESAGDDSPEPGAAVEPAPAPHKLVIPVRVAAPATASSPAPAAAGDLKARLARLTAGK